MEHKILADGSIDKTMTDKIFECSAPYDIEAQGADPRLLFVCSAGLLRSATGANLYAKKGYNTRNCGTHQYALIPLSANLIMWAHQIIFVNRENFILAKATFLNTGYDEDMERKSIVLDIEDDYNYNNPELIAILEKQLARFDFDQFRKRRSNGYKTW
jgi:predicted protein tyrosine phosphatase